MTIHDLMRSFGYGASTKAPPGVSARSRPAMVKLPMSGAPRQPVKAALRADPAAEARRVARQERQNAAAITLVKHLAADERARAARVAAANTPEAKARSRAQNMLAKNAALRGEKFDAKDWIEPPPQATRTATAAEIIAAGEKRRSGC